MELKFEVKAKIQKPVADVFDAVYNPKKLTQYFTTKSASAPLDEGTTVMWDFADFPGAFPVKVIKTAPNKQIVLEWASAEGGHDNRVDLRFEPLGTAETQVAICESGWTENQKGLNASYRNCQGWMQMCCCLKAYLEHGINLRQGFF